MPRSCFAAALVVLGVGACGAPFGEVLVVVDTDVSVPRLASALRVDLYSDSAVWLQTSQFVASSPNDWPLSFSVVLREPGERRLRLRLRAHRRDAVRDYRGEHFPAWPPSVEPAVPADLTQLCTNAPLLPPSTELTLRRGTQVLVQPNVQADCMTTMVRGGATAARIEISTAATYRFEVVRSSPDGSRGFFGGDSILFLRQSCMDAASQVACNDNIDAMARNMLSKVEVDLQPGTYYVLTTTQDQESPADVTLRWAPAANWIATTAPSPAEPDPVPRLVADGVDLTPETEPEPNLAIDQLIDLDLRYGERTSAHILLRGECFGTQADIARGQTCVERAGERVAVPTVELRSGIDRGGETQAGSWSALADVPCQTTQHLRPDSALYDETRCVPGGPVLMGSSTHVSSGVYATAPRQLAIVAPFFMDRYEVTVGRFRAAHAAGLLLPSYPWHNDGPLTASPGMLRPRCTYNGNKLGPAPGVDRETMPLNCLTWSNARSFCQFYGGDLPTRAEWERAARAAGRVDRDDLYPWGDAQPDCNRAAYARSPGADEPCPGWGPVVVDAEPWGSGNQTPLGIVGLAGNVGEFLRDSYRPLSDACWWQTPLRGVGCFENDPPLRFTRLAGWSATPAEVPATSVYGHPPAYLTETFGFRCVYPDAP